MSTILSVQNLTKTFGARVIIQDLTFTVEEGHSVAIAGPSGCGKSTLLNMIGMLESPSSGSIILEDKPLPHVNSTAATKLRRNSISYFFQSFALINTETVEENILLGMHFLNESKELKREKINTLLKRLAIDHLSAERIMTLSGGEQQRVALARSMLKQGNLILADEPTGSLDRHLADKVFEEFLSLQKDYGKTVLLVTHDPLIAAQCDTILELPRR